MAQVSAPVAGLIATSSAVIGAMRRAKGEALFSIIARNEFDLVGMVPTENIAKLKINQSAKIKVVGAGEVEANPPGGDHGRAQQASSARSFRGYHQPAPLGDSSGRQ